MAKDDMFVVMCKIVSYLYECMKKGVEPEEYRYSADYLEVNERYWKCIMLDLRRHGYVRGVDAMEFPDGKVSVKLSWPRVTSDGVQFMSENTMMAKAMRALRDAKDAIPFA